MSRTNRAEFSRCGRRAAATLFCTEPVTRFRREAIYQQAADLDHRYPERRRHLT